MAAVPLMTMLLLFTQTNFEDHFYGIQGTRGIFTLWTSIIISMIVLHVGEILVRNLMRAQVLYPWFATCSFLILIALGITARVMGDPQQAALIWLFTTPVVFLLLGRTTAHRKIHLATRSVR